MIEHVIIPVLPSEMVDEKMKILRQPDRALCDRRAAG